jgi:hypothetical protein
LSDAHHGTNALAQLIEQSQYILDPLEQLGFIDRLAEKIVGAGLDRTLDFAKFVQSADR